MKKVFLSALMLGLVFTSCGGDDDSDGDDGGQTCQNCPSVVVQGQTLPALEICEGENGNAFVMGTDTMVAYAQYIDGLELIGYSCN